MSSTHPLEVESGTAIKAATMISQALRKHHLDPENWFMWNLVFPPMTRLLAEGNRDRLVADVVEFNVEGIKKEEERYRFAREARLAAKKAAKSFEKLQRRIDRGAFIPGLA